MLVQVSHLHLNMRSTNYLASLCKMCRNDFLRVSHFVFESRSPWTATDDSEKRVSGKT